MSIETIYAENGGASSGASSNDADASFLTYIYSFWSPTNGELMSFIYVHLCQCWHKSSVKRWWPLAQLRTTSTAIFSAPSLFIRSELDACSYLTPMQSCHVMSEEAIVGDVVLWTSSSLSVWGCHHENVMKCWYRWWMYSFTLLSRLNLSPDTMIYCLYMHDIDMERVMPMPAGQYSSSFDIFYSLYTMS